MDLGESVSVERQRLLADEAVKLFKKCWNHSYRQQPDSKSDKDWLSTLRYGASPKFAVPTLDGFLKDYIVIRSFPAARRTELVETLAEFVRQPSVSPYELATKWRERGASHPHVLPLSAASKLLFFARPDQRLMIYDRLARKAVEAQIGRQIRPTREDFCLYNETALKAAKAYYELWSPTARETTSDESDQDFVLRRIADKYLFLFGLELEKLKSQRRDRH